ncbi:ubiquitin family protein Urm1 [Schizosaccharomyces japonicus yFS275]|uniref:Ubiquitin-related modifier 1 n=1 Tax=Schizosaccharomyces japonicus (strain yFS275 / FY16936) TaxID=402676 RepID=B6K4Q4_SCHJY|nr:ubiquitin family protein Urm1 [Schizosaccharomyces japonicus yFS275]EEB08461.1 ubiquitin family protein Urm1 [Schizosaccharomyces japonicus yFS275]
MSIRVELCGGLDLLFNKQKELTVQLTDIGQNATVGDLIQYMTNKIEDESKCELFVMDGSVRPGIIILVNDQDWELLDKEDYVLETKDNVVFVSTLHDHLGNISVQHSHRSVHLQ